MISLVTTVFNDREGVQAFFDAMSKQTLLPDEIIITDAENIVKDGKGKFVDVETGTRTANGIAITKGLSVGDSVVVTGVLFVRPNAFLKVRSVKKLDELVKEQ